MLYDDIHSLTLFFIQIYYLYQFCIIKIGFEWNFVCYHGNSVKKVIADKLEFWSMSACVKIAVARLGYMIETYTRAYFDPEIVYFQKI